MWNGPVSGLPEKARRPQDLKTSHSSPPVGTRRAELSDKPFRRGTPTWMAKGCTSPDAMLFEGEPGTAFRDCPDCPEMITVPAGTYHVGPPLYSSRTIFEVTFARPFAVGKYEITFEEWDACVADGGCDGYRPMDGGWGRGRQPVINVDWHQARSYTEWLSKKTGGVYRLLSEAEWEYVARAGSCTNFWWGDNAGTGNAVCMDCGTAWDGKGPAPVGQFKPNGFGLYDTAGNVSEWVEDCHTVAPIPPDGSALTIDKLRRTETCRLRRMRGGSWRQGTEEMRPESTEMGSPVFPNRFTGFRVAKALP